MGAGGGKGEEEVHIPESGGVGQAYVLSAIC